MVIQRLFSLIIGCSMVLGASAQPGNDICSSAIDLQSYLIAAQSGPVVAGPFSNIAATGNDVDITTVTGCWLDDLTGLANGSSPQIDATVWFRLAGINQVVRIEIQPCDTTLNFLSEDSQLALFSGECDSLQLVDCNEDLDPVNFNYWSAVYTTLSAATDYYLVVDGFNYSGFGSPEAPLTTGEFCIGLSVPSLSILNPSSMECGVFPNPTMDRVTVMATTEIAEIQVLDLEGQLLSVLFPNHASSVAVHLPEQAGLYLISVRTAQDVKTYRVVRQ